MNDQKYKDSENYSIESLDSNMKQIEATNNIINNLENQLSEFFSKNQHKSVGSAQTGSSHQHQINQDMISINQYSPNIDFSSVDENYVKSLNQKNNNNNNTMIIHNKDDKSDVHVNFYAESNPNSAKKTYNYQQDNNQIHNKENNIGHDTNQFNEKGKDYEFNSDNRQELQDAEDEERNVYNSDNKELERIKAIYGLNQQEEERRGIERDTQDDSLYQYKSQPLSSQIGANQSLSSAPLFQNKNLMQHFQTDKQQNQQYIYNMSNERVDKVNAKEEQEDEEEEFDDSHSQIFRGDISQARDNKSMLDNSVISVKNKEELENELFLLQKRLNQFDQESQTRRNHLDSTIQTFISGTQQPIAAANSQSTRVYNQVNKIQPNNAHKQVNSTSSNREVNSSAYQTTTYQTVSNTQGYQTTANYSTTSNQITTANPTTTTGYQTTGNPTSTTTSYQTGGNQIAGYLTAGNQTATSRTNSVMQGSNNTSAIAPSTTSSRGNDSIVLKLQKMEEFYQNRTRILEERINGLENENQKLLKTNSELMQQNEQLQQKCISQKEQFMIEIQQKLRDQEQRMHSEFTLNFNKFSSKNQEFLSSQLEEKHTYSKELESIKEERQKLIRELEEMKKNHIDLMDEKDNINQSYSNLLTVHNQILQIDIQKNERSLHHSFCQSSYSDRNSKPALLPNQLSSTPYLTNENQSQQRHSKQQQIANIHENRQSSQQQAEQIPQMLNLALHENQKVAAVNSSNTNQQQPEWKEELGKLKEELEIERRQRDKLEVEIRSQSQVEEKHLQEDNEEIHALYQKIFMNRELKMREPENKQEKDNSYRNNLIQRSEGCEEEDDGHQNYYDQETGFAPKFSHKEYKENSVTRNVQFNETRKRNSIFKNESISSNIPKSNSTNFNLNKSENNAQGESQSSRITYGPNHYNDNPSKELKKFNNQAAIQKKPPKTGGLASTPISKKQTKDLLNSRDNSQKRYSTVSQSQLGTSSSQENYNHQNLHPASSVPYSKNGETQINDKKFVKQFVKEVDKLKKILEQKKKKISNNLGNQHTNVTHSSDKNNKIASNDFEQATNHVRRNQKTPLNSSAKKAVGALNQEIGKRNQTQTRSNSANRKKY